MKAKRTLPHWPVWLAAALLGCALRLSAQSPPVITTQPTGQTNLAGTTTSFTVIVAGTGPFTYQWQLNGATNIISSLAGNGTATYAGDGGPAEGASLDAPSGVVVDAAGNLYIADQFNDRIRRVDTNGVITTVAGNGAATYAGDGGAATNASLRAPSGVAVDAAGNLYIADQLNCRVRRVDSNGIITTVAGNGAALYAGDGGAATNASFDSPSGVALDAVGNLYIADRGNDRVRLVNTNGFITPVAGYGSGAILAYGSGTYAGEGGAATNASLAGPAGVTLDAAGNLYVADTMNARVCKVDTNGIITTVAGNTEISYQGDGGAATNASLDGPTSVAFDPAGNLYIADYNNNRIRQVNPNGLITTVAGNGNHGWSGDGGAATNASLYYPSGLAVDAAGNWYIADCYNNRVRQVNPNGLITTVAGDGPSYPSAGSYAGDGGPAVKAGLHYPSGVALDAAGNLYVADASDMRVRRVASNGVITTVAGNGLSTFAGDGGPATNAGLDLPFAAVFDASGNMYIADRDNNRIRMVNTNGVITTVAGDGPTYPFPGGYAGDGGPATNASLNSPAGVALDAAGNLYIADVNNNRVREVHFAGFPALMLTNATTTNAGNYSVVITSPYGSVTSAVVSLTVTIPTTPPQIISSGTNFGFRTNRFGFNLNGAYGQTIVVDGSTNLLNWTPLFTNTANGSPFYFFDPAWTNFPWRFYRARLP